VAAAAAADVSVPLAFRARGGKELARAGAGAGDCLCDDPLLVNERSFNRREAAGRRRRRKKERKKERSCWFSIVPEMRISSGVVVVVVCSTEQQRRKRLLLQVQLICLLLLVVLSGKVFVFLALIDRFFFPHPFVFWD
jgi:hypothetical protein